MALDSAFRLTADQFGLRPVYYVQDGKKVSYADHITPLLEVQSVHQPNPISIGAYLGIGYVYSEDTFFKGVKRLLPGQELICDSTGRVVTHQYWRPHFSRLARSQTDINIAAEKTRELLLEAVESSIGGEKDIGVSLSGGLDSSSIVACVRKLQQNARIKTLSVISDDDPANREDVEYSELVANEFDTEHIVIRPNADDFWSEHRDFVRCQEEPASGMETYCDWKMHERAKNESLKKLLGGSGCDSLLMGVRNDLPLGCGFDLVAIWSVLLVEKEYVMLLASLLSFYDISLGMLWRNIIPFIKDPEGTLRLGSMNIGESLSSDLQCLYNNATYFGIEPQSPFLYLPLVEYLMTLPLDCKIRNGYKKYVLREAMKPLLSKKIVRRRSKGALTNPQSQWFNGPLREKLCDFFSQSLKTKQYYDPTRVRGMLARSLNEAECAYVWRILNLEIWFQEFF